MPQDSNDLYDKYFSPDEAGGDIDSLRSFYIPQLQDPIQSKLPENDLWQRYFVEGAAEKRRTSGSDIWNYLPDFIKKGYNESITGMAQQLATGEAPFDLENYHPSVLADIGAAVTSFFMPADIATFAAGAGVGGQAAKVAGKTALKQMIRAGVKKDFAVETLEKGMATLAGRVGVAAGSGSIALGTYSGLADAMSQEVEDNDIDFGQVLETAGKSALIGAFTGGIGGRAVHKGASEAVRVAQEIAAFGIAEPALDLRIPTPQDFLHAGGMILGIRGANMAIKGGVRVAKGEKIIQPKIKAKEASPEFIEEYAKRRLKFREDIAREGQIWTSQRKGFEKVEIVKEGETKEGLNVFRIRSVDAKKKKTISLGKAEFFKEFDLYQDAMSPEALRKKRIGEVKGLQRKLTKEEYGFDNKFLAEKKEQITGSKKKSSKDMSPLELFKYRKSLQYERDLMDIKKDVGPHLMEIEPGKSLVERLLPEKWVQPMLSAEARLKARESKTLGLDWIPKADARRAEIVGTYVEEAVFSSGLRKFKRPEEVADALEGKKVGREAEAIAKKIRISLKKAFKQAEDVGIDVAGYIENYFPRMMKKDIQKIIFDDLMPFIDKHKALLEKKIVKKQDLDILNNIIKASIKAGEFSRNTNNALNKLVKEGKLSYKDAMEFLRTEVFGEMYSPFGNLEKKRKLKLPSEFYERNAKEVITRYFDKFGRRIASAEVFGKKGEKAKTLLDMLRHKNPAEHKVLQELYANFTGLSSVDPAKQMSSTARKIAENIMSFEYATKIGLGFATIPNMTQFLISTSVEAGYWRTIKGAARLLNKDVRKKIRQSGATHHNVMDILLGTDMGITNPSSIREGIKKVFTDKGSRLANVANLITTISGFKGINYFNQLLAASTSEVFVKDLHKIAKSSPKKSSRYNWATNNLRRLGIGDYEKRRLSDKNIEHAMYRFAKDTQLQKDILKDPLVFNNPKLRPLFIFKRFGYRQAKYAKDTLKREISLCNVFVPLRLAAGGLAGASFIIWAKDALIKFLSGKDVVREDKEGFDRLKQALGVAGSMGFFSDLLEAEDALSSIKFTLTPVIMSDLEKGYAGARALESNIDRYGAGKWETYQRSIKGFAGIFGSVIRRAAEQLERPKQKEKGISQEKGRWRTKIFKYYETGEHDKAWKIYNDWNNKRPTNPFMFEEVNYAAYYQYLARKAAEAANP